MAKKSSGTVGKAESFTDTARVKALIALMADNGLTEIELVEDKSRIVLRRGVSGVAMAPMQHVAATGGAVHHVAAPASAAAAASGGGAGGGGAKADEGLITMKSPMVGTFYSAPNPDSDSYVSVGSEVSKDKTVVCVIEAMKVFNEVHADVSGTIARILVSNGQTVEFGQPLFLVKPA
ncbi:MAG: acetyl-CoA carboxylase biotin carboxyl carrier protein [Phycisphaerae bacterium]